MAVQRKYMLNTRNLPQKSTTTWIHRLGSNMYLLLTCTNASKFERWRGRQVLTWSWKSQSRCDFWTRRLRAICCFLPHRPIVNLAGFITGIRLVLMEILQHARIWSVISQTWPNFNHIFVYFNLAHSFQRINLALCRHYHTKFTSK